ncbi:phage tail assembly protein [uncultured Paracoccus sp.]|uniref:phage tail assembly protein n=1 Tax=uncultured Paracoccus sp. TaxID=189685 RepID=UPI002622AA25|nr:phage tail assembly protein [uncultured Paracoccus sp.]
MSDKKTITFTLEAPVEHDGQTYTTLTLRKMKAKDLVAADLVNGNLRKSLAIFASMAGVPIMVMEELDTDDFNRLGREAAPLMGKLAVKAMAKLEREEAGNLPLQ